MNAMDPQLKEAITLAAEISKQLMVLAIGILTVTVPIVTKFAKRISLRQLWVLLPAWIMFLFTILFALWHLSALTGNLLAHPIDPTIDSALSPAFWQTVSFGIGVILIMIFAISMGYSAWRREKGSKQQVYVLFHYRPRR